MNSGAMDCVALDSTFVSGAAGDVSSRVVMRVVLS